MRAVFIRANGVAKWTIFKKAACDKNFKFEIIKSHCLILRINLALIFMFNKSHLSTLNATYGSNLSGIIGT
jgi:hypothetical protein